MLYRFLLPLVTTLLLVPGVAAANIFHGYSFSYTETDYGIYFSPIYPHRYDIESIEWYFGDYTSSRRVYPTHYYHAPGTYEVKMRIRFVNVTEVHECRENLSIAENSRIADNRKPLERVDKFLSLNNDEQMLAEMGLLLSGFLSFVIICITYYDRWDYRRRGFPEAQSARLIREICTAWLVFAIFGIWWIELGFR